MSAQTAHPQGPLLTAGIDRGDFRGSDHRVLQAAVDYLASLGGGTLQIGPGTYRMRNALKLASRVSIRGTPGETILRMDDGFECGLKMDGDCNERQITPAVPEQFQVGDGVAIKDNFGGGFCVTATTLTSRVSEDTFTLAHPLYFDYLVSNKATIRRAFPVIGGWNVSDVTIEGITIDGNKAKNHELNGCRGGGIYLFESQRVTMKNCAVREYHGDGISFQVSSDVVLEDCVVERNASLGLHPGSGSQRPILRRNRSIENGSSGMYVCWRVKNGLFEDNELIGNGTQGISIGHKDTDNLFRRNVMKGNKHCGLLFRDESEPMGAHRNTFEENTIVDNGACPEIPLAAVVVCGHTHDLVFRRNKIGFSKKSKGSAFWTSPHVKGLRLEGNELVNVEKEIERA